MRRSIQRFLIPSILLMFTLSACTSPAPTAADPGIKILYFAWGGWSPGAGWGGTSLFACQYDLIAGRMRVLVAQKGSSTIEDGLPWQRDKILALLTQEPWKPLAPARSHALRAVAEAWIASKPPASYHQLGSLGTEDGATEEVSVTSGEIETKSNTNRRGTDPELFPTPEWYLLVSAIGEFSGIPQGHPGQLQSIFPTTAL